MLLLSDVWICIVENIFFIKKCFSLFFRQSVVIQRSTGFAMPCTSTASWGARPQPPGPHEVSARGTATPRPPEARAGLLGSGGTLCSCAENDKTHLHWHCIFNVNKPHYLKRQFVFLFANIFYEFFSE